MPGRGQAPIAAAPIRPGPRARHPRKRQPKYPNADCPRRLHLNAQEPSLSGDSPAPAAPPPRPRASTSLVVLATLAIGRSEEHTSELQSLMRISYAVFCLKKKKQQKTTKDNKHNIITHVPN